MPLVLVGLVCVYMLPSVLGIVMFFKWGGGFGSFYLAYRCLRYAITGKNNVNRDGF